MARFDAKTIRAIRKRWRCVGCKLHERGRRLFAAGEVRAAGWGGLTAVARITGLAPGTIGRGLKDLAAAPLSNGRVRRKGGGRPPLSRSDTTLVADLRRLVEPATLGCPVRPLLWVSKSHDKLAADLRKMGHEISPNSVRSLLLKLGYSKQSTRRGAHRGGSQHPDRDAQFQHIHAKTTAARKRRQPVISVDKKKEPGTADGRGRIIPYGVYDISANTGFVAVGTTNDTSEFAVATIRHWFYRMGRTRYPQATELTITADCGGSNSTRTRPWKFELQKLADATGLVIHVHHYPPGTSKWNKIEHRLFCHISPPLRAPLTAQSAVKLIAATTTRTGLKVESVLDRRFYRKGVKISDREMRALNVTGNPFHPEWNYTIRPRSSQRFLAASGIAEPEQNMTRRSAASYAAIGDLTSEAVTPQARK